MHNDQKKPLISCIAAIGAKNRVLGKDNDLVWKIPGDLKRFREITSGHPIIMGRKTFESIGRPLPKRENIVITRDANYTHDGIHVVHSVDEAIELAASLDQNEVFIIGGAQIIELALEKIDKLYLTLVHENDEGDVYFPEYKHIFTHETFREDHEENGLHYTYINLER